MPNTDFSLMLNSAKALDNPTLNEVSLTANALLNTLGEGFAGALRSHFDAARYEHRHRGRHALPEHSLFWKSDDCRYFLEQVLSTYCVTPDMVAQPAVQSWALPDGAQLILMAPSEGNRRLYFRRDDAQILVAHAYKTDFGKTPYSTAIADITEPWLRDTVGILYFNRGDWFSASMSHAKTIDSCELRLIDVAERIKMILDKHSTQKAVAV